MPADARPSSDSDALDEAERLLLDALEAAPDLPREALDELCAARPDLARGLREAHAALVAAHGVLAALHGANERGSPAPGTLVAGRFQVLGELGRGGMSVVLAAWDRQLRRKVALKRVHAPAVAATALVRRRDRLVHEAQVLAQLDHPGILPVHDVVRDGDGEVYVALQRVRGVDLREVYRRHAAGDREWGLARIVGVLQRACEAVAFAHDRGVLHRDLKPANVMVGAFGETFVMDWGLARSGARPPADGSAAPWLPAHPPPPSADADPAASLSVVLTDRDADPSSDPALRTLAGEVLGTPSYMSPEQARGAVDALDARSDVYGVGAMLYELLAGRPPYVRAGESRPSAEIVAEVRAAPPRPLSSVARHAPAELVSIAQRAMARDPERRYASMRELADDLRAFLEGRVVRAHGVGAWREARKWIGRHRGVVAVLGVLLVTVVAAAVLFALLYRESEDRRQRLLAAQLDSQRRINALSGSRGAGVPVQWFRDDFDGSELHRRWVCEGGCDQVSLRDGALVLRSPPHAQLTTYVGLDPHLQLIHGDFDVQVAFRLEGFELPAAPLGGRIACLQVLDATAGGILAAIGREVERDPAPPAPWEQSYRGYRTGTDAFPHAEMRCAPGDERVGALRVTRTGNECVASYYRDGWQELYRSEVALHPVRIGVFARNWYADEPFELLLDRIEVRADPASARADLDSFADDFSDARMDSRYQVNSRAAIASQIDGRLSLETFPGIAGRVEVLLDLMRWRLRGDFELEVDYDLRSFSPCTGPGVSRVSLVALTIEAEPFAAIDFEADAAGRRIVGRFNRGEQRRPLASERGRLRLERTGTTLRLGLAGPGGWDVLVERSHVDAALDFGFSLAAESPASSPGVVVTFDDLRLRSLSRR